MSLTEDSILEIAKLLDQSKQEQREYKERSAIFKKELDKAPDQFKEIVDKGKNKTKHD